MPFKESVYKLNQHINKYISAYLIFLGLNIINIFFLYITFTKKYNLAYLKFDQDTTNLTKQIQDQFDRSIQILESASATFSIDRIPKTSEFERYIETNKIDQNKAIMGLGYVAKIKNKDGPDFDEFIKKLELDKLTIFPSFEREFYYPIVFIFPMDERNSVVVGYDMHTEETRRKAMDKAASTGKASISDKVYLLQEIKEDRQPGVLMYKAIYSSNNDVLGYVYLPIRMGDFIENTIALHSYGNINFDIYSSIKENADSLLYTNKKYSNRVNLLPVLSIGKNISIGDKNLFIQLEDATSIYDALFKENFLMVFIYIFFASLISFILQIKNINLIRRNKELEISNKDIFEHLADSKNLKQSILNSINSSIIVLNSEGIITHVNNSWIEFQKDIKDQNNKEIDWLGLNYINFLYWRISKDKTSNTKKFSELLNKVMMRQSEIEKEIFHIRKGINSFWIEITISTIKSRKGGTLISISDITTLKELEKQKENFLGVASHELKTPLTTIKAYAQILKKKLAKNDKELIGYADKMNIQINRLSFLITQLLEVSRLLNGKMILNKVNFNLNELTQNIIQDYEIAGVDTITYHTDGDFFVFADRERIAQVIINLVDNAIKYSFQDNKKVDVFVTQEIDDEVKFSVRNYGEGIDEEKKDLIFESFSQIDRKKQKSSGLGLGLYISKQIIESHDAIIGFESNKDDNSTLFYFILNLSR